MKIKRPHHWRKGQFIFNFLEWIATEKGIGKNQSVRMADPFQVSDKDWDNWYEEFIKLHKEK